MPLLNTNHYYNLLLEIEMSSREEEINALIKKAKKQFSAIEREYKLNLDQQSISKDLGIDIKNLCENLRSALDYLAHDFREYYCPLENKKNMFYFPILPDINQFNKRVSEWYPGLDAIAPDLWDYLESIQPYNGKSTIWLSHFNKLNNKNKHNSLVPQTKTTREEVHVSLNNGGRISWTPSGTTYGNGASIGGVPVDPSTQLPIPHPSQKVKRIIWVDFHFKNIPGSAIELLKRSLDGVEAITSKVRKALNDDI